MSMQLISTVTVGSGGITDINLTSIPQTYTDLLVQMNLRSTDAGANNATFFMLNGAFSNHYYRDLIGDGAAVTSTNGSNVSSARFAIPGTTVTANTFGSVQAYLPNYSGSSKKSFSLDAVVENNATSSWQQILAGLWDSTSAVTSILLIGKFAQHSTISIYGITKGSGGASVS